MLIDRKLNESDFAGQNVKALDDRPTISAAELKAVFDHDSEEIIAKRINGIIDDLTGTDGASNIGTTEGKSLGEILVELVRSEGINGLRIGPSGNFEYKVGEDLWKTALGGSNCTGKGNLVYIAPNQDIPLKDRVANTFYLKVTKIKSNGLADTLGAGPNMGIKIIE